MMLATRALRPSDARRASASCTRTSIAEEPQLVDDVGAGAGVGLGADRTAADRAGQHADVGAGVLLGEDWHGPGTAGSPGSNVRGDEQNGEAEEMLDLTTPHLR